MMNRFAIAALLLGLLPGAVAVQGQNNSPTEAVVSFYRGLKNRQYVEGFRRSVYKDAVEGLSASDLKELEEEFARTFSAIPDKIEPRGEQITGDTATVFLKFAGVEALQQVALVREGGQWLVGDKESLALVRAQGRAFFFNTRILVNEEETYDLLTRMIGAEMIYAQKYNGRNAEMKELIRLGALPKELEGLETTGYRFTLTLGQDQKTFFATATPLVYGKTGRLSFYADLNGVRAVDLKGKPASSGSPLYRPN